MWYVYILFSDLDKKLYIGFTKNLKSRLLAHSNGYVKATQSRLPLKLIYYESYLSQSDARRREKYLKGGNGRETLKFNLVVSCLN